MYKKVIAVIGIFLLLAVPGYGAYNNWGNTDIHPLLGRELPIDLAYTGSKRGGVSTIVSQVSKLSSTNLAFGVLLLNGASKTFSISSGEPGQEITLIKNQFDARTLSLDLTIDNPNTTHTGFSSITFPSNAGSFVSLTWKDDTLGWVITGTSGDLTIVY